MIAITITIKTMEMPINMLFKWPITRLISDPKDSSGVVCEKLNILAKLTNDPLITDHFSSLSKYSFFFFLVPKEVTEPINDCCRYIRNDPSKISISKISLSIE